MYLIYDHNIKDNSIKPLDFSETSDDAIKILEDIAKEFIIENEGRKKWDNVFIEENTDLDKLKDGLYFIKKSESIQVYNKISETVNIGWILNSQELTHKLEHIHSFNIVEFQSHLLNKFIMIPICSTPEYNGKVYTRSNKRTNDIPDKLKPSLQTRSNLDDIINEIKLAGFKPIPRVQKSLK